VGIATFDRTLPTRSNDDHTQTKEGQTLQEIA